MSRGSLFQLVADGPAVSLDKSTAKTLFKHLRINCRAASVLLTKTHGPSGTLVSYDDSQNVRILGTRPFVTRAVVSLSLADDRMQSFGVSTQSINNYPQKSMMIMSKS